MATKVKKNLFKTVVYLGKDPNGKRIQKVFYGSSADEADYNALKFKIEKNKKDDPNRITLDEAITYYIDSKSAVLSPKTILEYRKMQKNRFTSLSAVRISEIDTRMLQNAVNAEAQIEKSNGEKISPKSIKNAYGLIVSAITAYYPERRFKVSMPKAKPIRYATPDSVQLAKILEITKGTDIEIPVLLAAWLSLRVSEICGLKWTDIHDTYIDINEVRIYVDGEQISKEPKTAQSARRIPLPSYIKDVLMRQEKTSEYVVNIKNTEIGKKYTKLLKNNGLPHSRFHDLRHANATIMHMLGVPDKYAQERGGWSTDHVMKKVYVQTLHEEQLRVANKIDKHFTALLENSYTNSYTEK